MRAYHDSYLWEFLKVTRRPHFALMSIMPDKTQFECPYQGHIACCAFAMETGTVPARAPTISLQTRSIAFCVQAL